MTKNLRSINPSESEIQCAGVEWANNTILPGARFKIGNFLIKNCNEGRRGYVDAKKKKKEGLKKGVSDNFLAYMKNGKGGLWIEVKRKGAKMTIEQIQWFALMNFIGYETQLVDTVEGFIKAIKGYLGMR